MGWILASDGIGAKPGVAVGFVELLDLNNYSFFERDF
jgi:hypothetical protein